MSHSRKPLTDAQLQHTVDVVCASTNYAEAARRLGVSVHAVRQRMRTAQDKGLLDRKQKQRIDHGNGELVNPLTNSNRIGPKRSRADERLRTRYMRDAQVLLGRLALAYWDDQAQLIESLTGELQQLRERLRGELNQKITRTTPLMQFFEYEEHLCYRTANSLEEAGIRTVGDLLRQTWADLQPIPNVGHKTFGQILAFQEWLRGELNHEEVESGETRD